MRKLIAVLGLLLVSLTPAFGQGFVGSSYPAWVYADNYGSWSLPGQNANTYSFTPSSICQITQLGNQNQLTFFAFSNNVAAGPVFVQDINSANSEVVTPSGAATQTQSTCAVSIAPVNSHTTFNLQSGTGGLQEAVNAVGAANASYPTTIVLSANWYRLLAGIATQNATLANQVTPAGVIAAATCTAKAQLVDVTSNPWTYWGCNSSGKFVAQTPAAPTVAAGLGSGDNAGVVAGTATLSAGSSNSSGTVTVTSGVTPEASGPIFTLTFAAPDYGGGFPYAPACTFTSVGTTAYTSGTASTTAGSGTTGGTGVLTSSATALAASTSGYKFTYSCH